ncbi:hypothetical protein ACIOBK_00675 [Micromonospora chokoriensis]
MSLSVPRWQLPPHCDAFGSFNALAQLTHAYQAWPPGRHAGVMDRSIELRHFRYMLAVAEAVRRQLAG